MNNNEGSDGSLRPWQPPQESSSNHTNGNGRAPNSGGRTVPLNGKASGAVDMWTVLDLVIKRWHWLAIGLAAGTAAFYLVAWRMVRPKYTATAQLLRSEILGKSDYLKTAPVSAETFAGILRSPEILQAVGDKLTPPVPTYLLNKWIKIDPEPDSDLVKIMAAARTPDYAVNLVNLYASNAVDFVVEQDAKQAAVLAESYLKKELTQMEERVNVLENQFRSMPIAGLDTNRLARISDQVSGLNKDLSGTRRTPTMAQFTAQAQRLQTAMDELDKLLAKYTEEHPEVKAKEQYIQELKSRMTASGTNTSLAEATLPLATGRNDGPSADLDIIHIKLRALEDAKVELSKRLEEAQLFALNKPATVKVFAPAELRTLKTNLRTVKIGVVTFFGGLLGLGAGFLLALLVEFFDNRVQTADDVARVTKLPVLTSLGDLRQMKPEDRNQWAFRTWTMLQGRLSPSANHGLICGVTSAKAGEGRSTWISLLAEAASLTGYRVLTIATRPSETHFEEEADDFSKNLGTDANPNHHNGNGQSNALTPNVLVTPEKITEELARPNSQPVVHIPLPGWVWNLERRNQWREALREWNSTENLVILVELPPATVPEAVLLGSNLPNMIWLTNSGAAGAAETRDHLETFRNARCNLVGAVLNRAPAGSLKGRFPRWLGVTMLLGSLAIAFNSAAQDPTATQPSQPTAAPQTTPRTDPALNNATGPQTNRTLSILKPSQRAEWQQHLTLGAGDVLTLNLYGAPELTRTEVVIGPDGRLSYLEAQDVMAAGLSIDELRNKLDEEIGKYRRSPRTMITPITFRSKKYYMLGKIATKGVYVLDRPMTVVEALARAHGFESALVDRNIYDMADFQHSFLARGGHRIPLDFEKLFQQGDLSQNIAIEPEDYIYISGTDVSEVYVLGEVRLPGTVSFTPQLTVIGAVAGRGGFTERAYRSRVLVVRGSLNNPERIAVDAHAILDGKQPNFVLKPRDVIYVSSRPFIKVEELADLATTAFIQSVITSWVGVDVVKPISQ